MIGPLFLWLIGLPMIALYGYVLYTLSIRWEGSAIQWFERLLPTDPQTYQWVSQDATRTGVWTDHPRGVFFLHYMFEIEKDSNSKDDSPVVSVVLLITALATFCSFAALLFCLVIGLAAHSEILMYCGVLFFYVFWMLAGNLLLVAWWLTKWVRGYNGVIVMSQGKSYAVHFRFSFWDLLTLGTPMYVVYEIIPEKVTQILVSADPQDVSRAKDVVTNRLVERFINWFLTPNGIQAVQLEALAAQYGKVIFTTDAVGLQDAKNAAAKRNNELSVFTAGTTGSAGAAYRDVRESGGTVDDANVNYDHVMKYVPEFTGPSVKVNIFQLMKAGFVMPAKPERQYVGAMPDDN